MSLVSKKKIPKKNQKPKKKRNKQPNASKIDREKKKNRHERRQTKKNTFSTHLTTINNRKFTPTRSLPLGLIDRNRVCIQSIDFGVFIFIFFFEQHAHLFQRFTTLCDLINHP